ncbi:hypothetical protein L2E82_20307 [Cichorium intybus]|uniref:Uncharacterized protein n=1 Tax=Cichorium intybus TaxID=13427 RepID=A0ACB9DTA9_CICIN|nr:hypothetical protein L2E82_20307 [Cichorium intybus]
MSRKRKYCTLVSKSDCEEGLREAEQVVGAISFQIIPADTQYQQGIGYLIYLEMRKRLQDVGVHSIFCWADEESEGFWLRQSLRLKKATCTEANLGGSINPASSPCVMVIPPTIGCL